MFRLLDSNINRVCEGLRVLEDISRFKYNDFDLSKNIKKLRHSVRSYYKQEDKILLNSRDVNKDVGLEISKSLNDTRGKTIDSLVYGNFKRVQEGLRTLEEVTKTHLTSMDYTILERIRYETYSLEKRFIPLITVNNFILPSIYGITYSTNSLNRSNITIVQEMISSGIKLIQYREKNLSLKDMFLECLEIRKLTKEAGVCFIINDHIDIAILVNADGVHIGQDDLPIIKVRELIGYNKIIGLSTHSPEQAIKAVKDGANYIGVGPIFETKTKVNVCDPVGYEYLEWVNKNINIPYVAIGGIKEHNLVEIISRGAKSVALVSEITSCPDIRKKVASINNIIKEKNYNV